MIDKATKVLIAKHYIDAQIADNLQSYATYQAMQQIFVDGSCAGVISPLASGFTELVAVLLGENAIDWIYWWIYDTDVGTRDLTIIIDSKTYKANQLTIDEYLDLVIV